MVFVSLGAAPGCVIAVGDGDDDTTDTSDTTDASSSSSAETSASASSTEGESEATTGDGDTTTGDGDGDGDTTTGDGDGDGDGDGTTGDGDGDGDGAVDCTPLGIDLVNAINQERAQASLPAIPVSPSLCHVAQVHSQDLVDNEPDASPDCNLHSWSDQGAWSACCYTSDHAQAQCMWDKPSELTNYTDNGFEISAGGYPDVAAAVQGWMGSSGHRAVILNEGIWADNEWQAIGGGYVDGHWNVWFGESEDPGWP